MKKKYTFCNRDGSLKKSYIPICEYILEAKTQKHEIYIGRSETIMNSYECFTTPSRKFYAKEKEIYKEKIKEVCSNFDITTNEWYSYMSMCVELHGDNVRSMFDELSLLLGGIN